MCERCTGRGIRYDPVTVRTDELWGDTVESINGTVKFSFAWIKAMDHSYQCVGMGLTF